ncbi:hypothetical protein [Streptomyces carpinensis]|uniref:Uncharacterized protein n=1 Tax=Streptomyces carpinensis TaxID=66369 RepID=A0ABV1VYB8_9ACTN|nr:hypothetical protein [Streptomyces carpinensis]
MVSVSHTVLVESVPFAWLVDALAVVRSLVEESRAEAQRLVLPDGHVVPGVRLTSGRHLRPGAVYLVSDRDGGGEDEHRDEREDAKTTGTVETFRIQVAEWDRRRAVRVALAVASDDGNVELDTTLQSLDRPRLVEVSGRARFDGVPFGMSRVSGRARVRLDDWWAAAEAARETRPAPATARLDHPWARAEVRAVPRPHRQGDGGRWEVCVTVSLRGRGLLRPFVAVVLGVAGRRIRRSVVRALDGLAESWNADVPRLVAMDRDGLRAALTARS